MPDGSTDNRDMFISFNARIENSGNYNIKVTDALGCEDSIVVNAEVIPLPTAGFPEVNDTIWYENSYLLQATQGYDNYQWSTGDTTYYITVSKEGEYTVLLQTSEGCSANDTVMMMNALVPVNVPNAFTPNGDGLNDVFRPVVDEELVRRFHMSIYNRWGQRIFETNNVAKGWDGKNAMADVYVWVITYENRIGKAFEVRGTVTLIK